MAVRSQDQRLCAELDTVGLPDAAWVLIGSGWAPAFRVDGDDFAASELDEVHARGQPLGFAFEVDGAGAQRLAIVGIERRELIERSARPIDTTVMVGAFDGELVIAEFALDPFEDPETRAIGPFVEDTRGDERGVGHGVLRAVGG